MKRRVTSGEGPTKIYDVPKVGGRYFTIYNLEIEIKSRKKNQRLTVTVKERPIETNLK